MRWMMGWKISTEGLRDRQDAEAVKEEKKGRGKKKTKKDTRKTYQNNPPPQKTSIKARDTAQLLAIILGQAPPKHNPNSPHSESNSHTNRQDDSRPRSRRGGDGRFSRRFRQCRAPVPKSDDVALLTSLDDAGAEDPACYWCTTCRA